MALTVVDSYTTGRNSNASMDNDSWKAMVFTASKDYDIEAVQLPLWKSKYADPGTCTFSIRAVSGGLPTGSDLTSGTTDGDTLPEIENDPPEWREITFSSSYSLTSGTQYAIVARPTNSSTSLFWGRDSSGSYSGGQGCYSNNSGSSWSADSGADYLFETYEEATQDIDEGTLSAPATASITLLTENIAIDVELSVSANGSASLITEVGYIAGQYEEGTLEISASGSASLSVEVAAVGGQYDEGTKGVSIVASVSLKRQAYVDGSGFPYNRPTDYDRNEAWDEDNEEWVTTASLLAKGAGRLRTQFVVAAGNKIYVEAY